MSKKKSSKSFVLVEKRAEYLGNFADCRMLRVRSKSDCAASPSEHCKAAGLKSLAEVAEMVRKPPQTLRNWHRDSPELFAIVVAGAVVIKADNAEVNGGAAIELETKK